MCNKFNFIHVRGKKKKTVEEKSLFDVNIKDWIRLLNVKLRVYFVITWIDIDFYKYYF